MTNGYRIIPFCVKVGKFPLTPNICRFLNSNKCFYIYSIPCFQLIGRREIISQKISLLTGFDYCRNSVYRVFIHCI